MSYICTQCFSVFKNEINYVYHIDTCLHERCYGDLINIDDSLVMYISQLWELHVKTKFSCGGHLSYKKFHYFQFPYLMIDYESKEFELIKEIIGDILKTYKDFSFKEFISSDAQNGKLYEICYRDSLMDEFNGDLIIQINIIRDFENILYKLIHILKNELK